MAGRPLRILDLRDSPWVDGPGRTILESAAMVDSRRYEIIIGAFNDAFRSENAYLEQADEKQLTTVSLVEHSAFDRKVLGQITDAIDRLSIDIVHTHDFRSDIFGLLCAKRSKVPIISTCHGWIANNLKGRVYTFIDKFSLRYFNHVITVSNRIREQLITSGVDGGRISVIPNALVIDNYVVNRNDRSFREEMGLDSDTRIIANIGRLSPEKGQEIFLHAAKTLLQMHNNLCFVLIGKGPQEAYLEELAENLGIAPHVRFAGYRTDMVRIYNSLDLVVQSSFTEGMPNVILESLLMEVPVVATDVGGTSEVVRHDHSGVLIEADSLEQLVRSIDQWINNPQRHITMARRGRDDVSQKFDHNLRVKRLMDVYDQVAATGGEAS